ncbi:hypothetical protein GCM10010862_38820 [Devosia nitrariae]|uniref:DUF1275 domain-containing protein n=1 Tax=Devosia nitrariae TaxID=2071872 RepID=A0ABQ5W9A9_9HYPH|nr:hypothetical protein GCM10010862_38820 [Devosia nitrariae]
MIVGVIGVTPITASAAFTIPVLCFAMGLQNATITKISGARMRTTHVTGMLTDIGVEMGRLIVARSSGGLVSPAVIPPDRRKLMLYASLVAMFVVGGFAGALGFFVYGLGFAFALSLPLVMLAAPQFAGRTKSPPRKKAAEISSVE